MGNKLSCWGLPLETIQKIQNQDLIDQINRVDILFYNKLI